MEGWDSFDGQLALKGVDPRDWTLRRMINAVEYQILNSATDEKEAAKLRAKLYTPPRPVGRQATKSSVMPQSASRRASAAQGQQSTSDILAMIAAQDSGAMRPRK